MHSDERQIRFRKGNTDDDDTEDPTAPFHELQSFDSMRQALQWKEIRTRVPVCFRKTICNRYMLANLVFLGYAIGILIIDFNSSVNGSSTSDVSQIFDNRTTTPISILDQPISDVPLVTRLYIGKSSSLCSKRTINYEIKMLVRMMFFFLKVLPLFI